MSSNKNENNIARPVVMTFSGHDPSGGAGIQADIEAIASMGCHASPIITTITVQDSREVFAYSVIEAETFMEQARIVLEDMPVCAFKVGVVGDISIIEALAAIFADYPQVPVVVDPVLRSGNGTELTDDDTLEALCELILPCTTVLTPNSLEAREIAPNADSLEACSHQILEMGCDLVLITGTHENTEKVTNTLYNDDGCIKTYSWERLPHEYHGSGCTLAASIAGLIGNGYLPVEAIEKAQQYTWDTLNSGYRAGMGQHTPNRFFWDKSNGRPPIKN